MNAIAVVLLAAAAIAGATSWYAVEHHREPATTARWVAMAVVPAVLLAAAALFGLRGGPAGDVLLDVARVVAVVAAVTGGSVVATAILRIADRGSTITGDGQSAESGDATTAVSDPRTLRGGTSIGVLERIGVAVTLLAGWPEGLALVLAVKGFGRYPELHRPVAAERFIIGTLASVLWAIAAVGVVAALRW